MLNHRVVRGFNGNRANSLFIKSCILIVSIIYWIRRDQLKKVTESEYKYMPVTSDIVIAYSLSLTLVVIAVASAIYYS